MKVAFLSSYDPLSTKSWSGTPYYMLKALKDKNIVVDILGPVDTNFLYFLKIYKLILKLFGRNYDYSHSKLLSKVYAKKFSKKLEKLSNIDFIIAPAGSTQIAYLETEIPIIYLSDTTFDQLKNYYPNFKSQNFLNDVDASFIESKALEKAAIISFPSKWASEFCMNFYRIERKKIVEIQWGANFSEDNDLPFLGKSINSEKNIKIIFLGVDWKRKGGQVAFEAVKYLREKRKIDATLTICGCTPDTILPEWVDVVGLLNKNIAAEHQKFINLMRDADILLLPTVAECYGMVFCEAAAFGIPSVATDTGGINSIVINEETGLLIKDAFDHEQFGDALYKILSSENVYNYYSTSARKRYSANLNWNIWAEKIIELMYEYKK
ncbi:glycosyltransferase family 4 protein [Citrobacter freundii]|uniref:glycosyltransferase family 4 protein n=1 Tax=Citrobacter freundii TaxID=546 RepID=UPI0015C42E99|nr:glycosyltransferase family 4 protein [Citrobacter freundii]ELN4557037.1 glycosyltransferase family 4 protein [Citrobacter freundii]NWO34924.1 glycosyltransferase family 4 protein [Citrobacter freundii]WOR61880.1 glycosyltransferase family 4 protein [Citrobacter freundii]HAT2229528.1 glycosyltransferase family 4 protein [Citrobacter freundii]HAT2570222.1 glycosyltransferase family 4 protein [Citrobacter freundii]